MNKMLLHSFGCFVCFFLFSFSVSAKEIGDKLDSQKKDTSITSTGVVMAVAETAPIESIIYKAKVENSRTKVSSPAIFVTQQDLFKQLHPLSISFVQSYQKKNDEKLEKIKTKFTRQFLVMDNVLKQYELPVELKYLAIIESELFNGAVSNKGAVGAWQFMASTGRLMGLTINKHRDERRDLNKSTVAAAKYLKSLYGQFNDWLLVIAAYNGGASRVEYAIRKSGSRDFWKLQYYLPAESRGHVKKFVAARYVFECQAATLAAGLMSIEKLSQEEIENSATVHISGKYRAAVIARVLEMDVNDFNDYNPSFDKEVVSNGYDLRLPKEKMDHFSASKQEILSESIQAMLNDNNNIIGSGGKDQFPEAIQIARPKAINADDGKKKK